MPHPSPRRVQQLRGKLRRLHRPARRGVLLPLQCGSEGGLVFVTRFARNESAWAGIPWSNDVGDVGRAASLARHRRMYVRIVFMVNITAASSSSQNRMPLMLRPSSIANLTSGQKAQNWLALVSGLFPRDFARRRRASLIQSSDWSWCELTAAST